MKEIDGQLAERSRSFQYPFNDQRTKGPKVLHFKALRMAAGSVSSVPMIFHESLPQNLGPFFPFSFGGLEAKKLRGPRTARILFQSFGCTFEAPQTPKSFGIPTKKFTAFFFRFSQS